MSGYWHDVNHTAVSTYPAGSLLHGYDVPVDEDCVALTLAGDEVTVIEGDTAEIIELLQQAIDRLEKRESTDWIPPDALPEGTWYWPEEFEDRPDFITTDYGETWTPLCLGCNRRMKPLSGNSWANWECTNYDAHGLSLALIWAEDWPDYEGDED